MSDKREQVEKLQKGTAKLDVGILIAVLPAVAAWPAVANLG